MSLRFAIGLGSLLVGWYLGYRQGFADGQQAITLWSNESVTLGDWR